MTSRGRPPVPVPDWVQPAAVAFCDRLSCPKRYGDPPRRDVIGWVASLLAAEHTTRWLRLCAAVRRRHPHASDQAEMDEAMRAVAAAIVEAMVLPLLPAENKRVLTTNVRRHVKRTSGNGLTFMHVFDFFVVLFDFEENLHKSQIASQLHQEGSFEPSPAIAAPTLLPQSVHTAPIPDQMGEVELEHEGMDVNGWCDDPGGSELDASLSGDDVDVELECTEQTPDWTEVFALNYFFNIAVEKFRVVCEAVGTRHVRNGIEAATCDFNWARTHAAICGLDVGQARIIHLAVLKGASAEGDAALQRSHFTVYKENDPLVFAAALSTLDPDRAIIVADRYVGMSIRQNSLVSQGGTTIPIDATRSATNLRKLMYTEALLVRLKSGIISQSSFMHLTHKLTMLNSGLGANTPGSTWAEPWPRWPPLSPTDKDLLGDRYALGNIVAGALLAATVLANHIVGVGAISESEFQEALRTLREISELGDVAAPAYVGQALSQPGPLQNIDESERFYRLAVDRGNKNAPAALGRMLLDMGRDAVESTELFKLSIARGGRYGQRFLAEVLLKGAPGVPQDTSQAKRLFQDAAGLGDPDAMQVIQSANW